MQQTSRWLAGWLAGWLGWVLTRPHRGNSARSALERQGAAAMWVAPIGMPAARALEVWWLHQLWVRVRCLSSVFTVTVLMETNWVRVRRAHVGPASGGSTVFGGCAALHCLAYSAGPPQQNPPKKRHQRPN
jgi:hypothetical protein